VVVAMIAIAAAVVYKTRAEPRRSRRDRKKSAPKPLGMRERILWKDEFAAAVFVRGMCGIIDEHRMFVERAPDAVIVPVASAGGAAAILAREIGADPALLTSLELRRTLHAHLGIDPTEARFRRLASSRGTLQARLRAASCMLCSRSKSSLMCADIEESRSIVVAANRSCSCSAKHAFRSDADLHNLRLRR
jgi:hypothetical protein